LTVVVAAADGIPGDHLGEHTERWLCRAEQQNGE
jgi:hypothetical protein